jgi:hypothetical protein
VTPPPPISSDIFFSMTSNPYHLFILKLNTLLLNWIMFLILLFHLFKKAIKDRASNDPSINSRRYRIPLFDISRLGWLFAEYPSTGQRRMINYRLLSWTGLVGLVLLLESHPDTDSFGPILILRNKFPYLKGSREKP